MCIKEFCNGLGFKDFPKDDLIIQELRKYFSEEFFFISEANDTLITQKKIEFK